MVLRAIVKVTNDRKPTIETIVAFDNCLHCGCERIKDQSCQVMTNKGTMYVHYVSCCCGIIGHKELDQDWAIIRMLNSLYINVDVNLTP